MYIEKINIVSFGRLNGREITLRPGVNVFEGDNESGKSTVAAFIKFILYGMKDAQQRLRYISWGGTSASGSITVTTEGQRILIERTAAVSGSGGRETVRETVRMTDIETGLELHRGKCPGEVLLGVPEDVFSGTAFVRQLGGARLDGSKMSAAAENLLFSGDEEVNTAKAAEKIDLLRRQLLYKNNKGGAIYEKESKIKSLSEKLTDAKRASTDLINVEAAIADLGAKRDAAVEKRDAARRKAGNYEALQNLRRFDRLGELRDEVARLYGERDALLSEDGASGRHFPDAAYIGELHAVADGMAATSASIAAASRQLDALRAEEAECPDRELYARLVDEENVDDEIIKEIEGFSSRRSVFSIMALLTLIFAGICAVLTVLFLGRGLLVTIPLASAAGVLAAAAAAAAVISILSGVRYRRGLRRYGASGTGELRAIFEDMTYEATEHRHIEEDITAAEAELYVQYSVYDDEIREARELLRQRGVEADDDTIGAALSETIASCEALSAREREISDAVRRGRTEIGELERQLSGVSEEDVRAATDSINKDEYDAVPSADLKREREFTENAVLRLTESIHELEIKRAQLMASREDPAAISVAIDTLTRELEADRARFDACVLAIDALEAAGHGVRESVAPRLREMAREYMRRISDGKYSELGVDAAFGLTISADGAYRDIDCMSGGTVDAAYLSLRLALVRLLYRRELPPLIFDESFSQMDDARTGAMLSIISGDGELQSLILTCQGRETRLLSGTCNIIKLS